MPPSTQPPDRYTQALITVESLYESYLLPTLPAPVATILSTLLSMAIQAQPYISQLSTLFTSLISNISGSSGGSAESMALVSTAVMIITLYISLRVFNYMRKMVMGWVILAVKMVIVLVLVQVGFYINRYGWERAARDASWWGGIAWGFIEDYLEGGKDGNARAPRGTRSRGNTGKRGAQYGYQGRDQVPVGGRGRWI